MVVVTTLPPCDFCSEEGVTRAAKYDGKTRMGPWANMCEVHFRQYGIGLGTGLGQKLIVKSGSPSKTFEVWKAEVNKIVAERIGLSADDLPDCCYRDWYDAGVTAKAAAARAIKAAKECFG